MRIYLIANEAACGARVTPLAPKISLFASLCRTELSLELGPHFGLMVHKVAEVLVLSHVWMNFAQIT